MCRFDFVGVRAAQPAGFVLWMSSQLIIKMSGCSDTSRSSLSARACILLYVASDIALAEFAVAVESGGLSTDTISCGMKVGVTCTSLS